MKFPEEGWSRDRVLEVLASYKSDDVSLEGGHVFAYGFHPDAEIESTTRHAYMEMLSRNAIDPTSFPSLLRIENDVVRLVAELLQGDEDVVGNVTSGGTESILLAVKTARDKARAERPEITEPAMVLPQTAHCAFHKAASYFQVKPIISAFDPQSFRTDVVSMRRSITHETIMLVASAPSYAHGVIDPIQEMGKLALEKNLWLHIDACVGGIPLSILRRSGKAVPSFDFSVPGVTSISTDMHKYGYSPKGASVVLYRNKQYRRYQIFSSMASTTYALINPTMQSTRSGGPMTGAWAALLHIGESGYRRIIQETMEATRRIIAAVQETGVLRILGKPDLSLLAIASEEINIFELADEMSERGWYLQPQFSTDKSPANLHLTVTYRNAATVEPFLADLRASVEKLSREPGVDLNIVREQVRLLVDGKSEEEAFALLAELGGLGNGGLPKRMAMINSILDALPRSLGEKMLADFANDLYV